MLLKSGRKSREIGAWTGIEALKFSMSHDYEIRPSCFPHRPILGPELGSLPIQIHQIFLAIDLHDGAGAVPCCHSIPDLEAFLAWPLGLSVAGPGRDKQMRLFGMGSK